MKSEDKFSPEVLREALIISLQRHAEVDEPEENLMELPGADSELLGNHEDNAAIVGMQVVEAAAPSDAVEVADPGALFGGRKA